MAGGNLVGQGLAGALPSPLVSRLSHIQMDAVLVPEHKQILGTSIYHFLAQHPKFVYAEPEGPNLPFPTLRTWEMASKIQDTNVEAYTAIVGLAAATEYVVHLTEEKQILQIIHNNSDPFPIDRSQNILDYLKVDKTALEKNLGRFEGEWAILAELELKAA